MTPEDVSPSPRHPRAPRWAAWFALLVGLLVFSTELLFLVGGAGRPGAIPSERVLLHLVAEGVMAVLLLCGGLATLLHRPSGRALTLVALGMLLYSLINTSGFYVQRQQWGMVALSAGLALGAVAAVYALRRPARRSRTTECPKNP